MPAPLEPDVAEALPLCDLFMFLYCIDNQLTSFLQWSRTGRAIGRDQQSRQHEGAVLEYAQVDVPILCLIRSGVH